MEDDISDNEALKLIQSSSDLNKSKDNEKSQNTNTFILDEENQDQTVDPFTHKLMNLEVLVIDWQEVLN